MYWLISSYHAESTTELLIGPIHSKLGAATSTWSDRYLTATKFGTQVASVLVVSPTAAVDLSTLFSDSVEQPGSPSDTTAKQTRVRIRRWLTF